MPKEQIKSPFTVSYYSLNEPRIPPAADILEDRWLHKLFLLTHAPADWPAWKLAAGLLLAALGVWLAWLPLGSTAAIAAAAIYFGFAGGDWLLLGWLPKSGRSFGPVGPQLYVKTAPRLGAAIILALPGWIFGTHLNSYLLVALVLLQLIGTVLYLWGMGREPFALATSYRSIESAGLPHHAATTSSVRST